MRLWFLIPILGCSAIGQTSAGINASASRTVTLNLDEAAFTIVTGGSLDSTQQQVKQVLQEAGLPNPTVVTTGLGADYSSAPGAARVSYLATVTIPAGSARDAVKSIEALRTHLPVPLMSFQYSVAFQASQATRDAARQAALPQLVADAQKQAQSLAAAAGVKLGGIRSISDSAGGVYAFAGVIRNGDFSGLLAVPPASSAQYTFSVNVIFAAVP